MLIKFWGVRGSLPSPILESEIKSKISTIVERIVPEDLADAESRRRFLKGLPPWLYGAVGGNSPCVSIDLDGFGEPIVFDCGSGLRELGIAYGAKTPMPLHYHIFLSHLHWDHILGFPFFNPAYNPSVSIHLHSPDRGLEEYFSGMMNAPYFPVTMESMAAQKDFHLMEQPLSIGSATIACKKMNHPGDSFTYMVNHKGKRFIYATDVELATDDFMPGGENTAFFRDADIIVLDSQYTLGEAIDKYNWGHSAFSLSVDFAANWGIKHLILFHHDPDYDDRKLHGILQSARWYLEKMDVKGLEITLAVEGMEISL